MAVVAGTGLQAQYFNNPDFTGSSVARIDKKVYFNFSVNAPAPSIAPTTYSVRWTGKIKPSYSETYTFHTTSDDGVRLWVDHKLVIDDWNAHAPKQSSGTIKLDASRKVDIQLEYFNKLGGGVAQLWWASASQVKSVVPPNRLYPEAQNLGSKIDHAFAFAEQQIAQTLADVGNNPNVYVSNTVGSGARGTDGRWMTTNGASWTSGFLGGLMWEAYQKNSRKPMRLNATAWTQSLSNQTAVGDDMGFRINLPFKNLSGAASDATRLAAADAKLGQWDATVEMFRSSGGKTHSANPAGDFAVLIDHAMDMELLYWASKKTGNTVYRDRATAHLLKLAQNYVRADGSTAQWGYYSSQTGQFIGHDKKQAYSATSAWSRGQAWAIYAYSAAYRETGNASLLAMAKKVAEYYITHMPADGVPYWDFASPAVPNTFRDTSAAAITASGLFDLANAAPLEADKARYRAVAEQILTSLTSAGYLAEGSTSHGVLLHGAAYVPRKNTLPDNSLVYGDYYFLEAMNRYAGIS
jgi:hypothetical protein